MEHVTDESGPLLERARLVLPQDWPFGSVWAVHHEQGAYPHFAQSAEGAYFQSVDGRRYLDWFIGGGVTTLGHRHPAVQRAMLEQLERGVHLSLPSGLEVEVAERLCGLFQGAEQVAFGKNGSDVTAAGVRLARAITGREHVLVCGYHGWHDWAKAVSPEVTGIPAVARGLVQEFGFNDLAGAERCLAAAGGAVAAIVVEPIRYAEPTPEFLVGLRALADRHGCLLVFDEVVTGLRVARGGAQQLYGVRADLTCLAKSLANGLPLAALLGPRRHLRHLPPAFFALTYQREALSLAAAKASLDVHRAVDVAGHLLRIGQAVQQHFMESAARHRLPCALVGHPAMLHMQFAAVGRLTARGAMALFVECCQRAGVYLQPFRVLPSLAHGPAEVAHTAIVVDAAMAMVAAAAQQGLARHLDSPVWGGMEATAPSPAVVPTSRRPLALPVPWLRTPPSVAACGGTVKGSPAASAGEMECGGEFAILRVEQGQRECAATREVELAASLVGDFRIVAHFRFRTWQPGNAVVTARLAVEGIGAAGWHEVSHQSQFGQTPKVQANLAGQQAMLPATYGLQEGRLALERRGGTLVARWRDHRWETVLEVALAAVPLRARFVLRVAGPTRGAVELELRQLEVVPESPAWPQLDALVARAQERTAGGDHFAAQELLGRALLDPESPFWPAAERTWLLLEDAWRQLGDADVVRRGLTLLAALHAQTAGRFAVEAAVAEVYGQRPRAAELARRGLELVDAGPLHARLSLLLARVETAR